MARPVKRQITVDRLREVLSYDAETGVFTWLRPTAYCIKVGQVAGARLQDGYLRICVDGEKILAHRLAWFYVTGEWPAHLVDHINGVVNDNRFANLRKATPTESNFNRKTWGKSAYRGVSWAASHGKWGAHIQRSGVKAHLGFFADEREAAEAYLFAALEHHGEFARAS